MIGETFRGKKILVVVAHPDDELLGLGATIHQLIHQYGCEIRAVILGEGITSRADVRDQKKWERELSIHQKNIRTAQKIIGYQSLKTYDFPDNRFDTVALLDLIKVVEKEKDLFKPEVIFTHHGGDLNIDHQRTFEAVMTACRPLPDQTVKTIITFETLSGTEWRASSDPRHFVPNFFFGIDKKSLEIKIKGMQAYEFEKRKYPHPRSSKSIFNRAEMWGNTIGTEYAEPFHIVRTIS